MEQATDKFPHEEDSGSKIIITEESYEWIFEKYYPRLVFYSYEFLADEEQAKDSTINLFVTLWEQREKIEFKNEKLLQGYLYSVAKHKAIDIVRDRKKQQLLLKQLGMLGNLTQHPDEMDNALILTEAIAFIHQAMEELTPQYRSVIQLFVQGKSFEDIAEILHITPASVRSNKTRAIVAIQKKFKGKRIPPLMLLLLSGLSIDTIRQTIPHIN